VCDCESLSIDSHRYCLFYLARVALCLVDILLYDLLDPQGNLIQGPREGMLRLVSDEEGGPLGEKDTQKHDKRARGG